MPIETFFHFYIATGMGLVGFGFAVEHWLLHHRAHSMRRRVHCPQCHKRCHAGTRTWRIKCRRCGKLFESSLLD